MNDNTKLIKPIFILGAHKSGTSYLRALLDGHPDLYVVPLEAHYFQHLGFNIENYIRSPYTIDYSKYCPKINF